MGLSKQMYLLQTETWFQTERGLMGDGHVDTSGITNNLTAAFHLVEWVVG